MLLLFTFGVQLLATEKKVWNTISYQCIHQNFAKKYNDSTDLLNIIVYWQVTDLGKDLCLLAPACLANDSSAGNCNERQ